MGMGLQDLRAGMAGFAATFVPAALTPAEAAAAMREAAAIENIAATVKALAALRAAQDGAWRREGARSPAHDLARKTGTSVGAAQAALDTADKLAALPQLDAAARAGEVSAAQASPIAEAASADPAAEQRLVAKARRASLGELRDECARIKAAAEPDDAARHEAIHRRRHLRRRRCADGAGELWYRSTLDEVAEIFSIIQGHANRQFDLARLAGRHEPEEAYLADGLLAACRAASGAGADTPAAETAVGELERRRVRKPTPTKVVVRVDWDALVRGWPVEAEVCEIAGLGPVPVSVVRAMLASGDAVLAAVVTKGVDVANVVHLGRKPTVYQGTALDWLSPTCATEGCNRTDRLETDHREDWARTRVTLLRWLERHCHRCHQKKTRDGWALVPGQGKRPLVPPDDPRHPRHRAPAAVDTG
ncbi:MAG TPA: DUF222 domain-containing protein [Acidimicrobiales bacterium]|nr:DUF222 domain-containing protein [Acidimicrobiales bacterium]